jgi:hypothetical protein
MTPHLKEKRLMNRAAGKAIRKYPRLKATGTSVLSVVLMRNILENVPTMGVVTLLAKPQSAKQAVINTKAGRKLLVLPNAKDLFSISFIGMLLYFVAKIVFFL